VIGNTDDVLRIGHLTFWGGEGDDGFFIEPGGFEGWSDAPPTRLESLEVPDGHGSYDAEAFYEARVVTVTGQCLASSDEELEARRNELMGVLRGQFTAHVNYRGLRTHAQARRFSTPKFQDHLPGLRARYQFSFRCPNPRRFGIRRHFSGVSGQAVMAFHRGNFDATSVLTIAGTMPGYSIKGPRGASYDVTAAVVPGRPHTIDLATGRLAIAGVPTYGVVPVADLWTIPPGVQVGHTLVPISGSGTLDVSPEDTYI
jgi:hypothetical protein